MIISTVGHPALVCQSIMNTFVIRNIEGLSACLRLCLLARFCSILEPLEWIVPVALQRTTLG